MLLGIVLISTAPVYGHEVYNKLLKVPQVLEINPLFGEYDLIARIEANDFDGIQQIVIEKIRSVNGVIDTKTLIGGKF